MNKKKSKRRRITKSESHHTVSAFKRIYKSGVCKYHNRFGKGTQTSRALSWQYLVCFKLECDGSVCGNWKAAPLLKKGVKNEAGSQHWVRGWGPGTKIPPLHPQVSSQSGLGGLWLVSGSTVLWQLSFTFQFPAAWAVDHVIYIFIKNGWSHGTGVASCSF